MMKKASLTAKFLSSFILSVARVAALDPINASHQGASSKLLSSSFGLAGQNQTFDYVIVGGGTSGLTTAMRLSADGKFSVAVIEACGFYEFDAGNISVVPAYSSPSSMRHLPSIGRSTPQTSRNLAAGPLFIRKGKHSEAHQQETAWHINAAQPAPIIYGLTWSETTHTHSITYSPAGGVGHAAIHICRMVGAVIFATVGNDEKVEYLVKTFGIPRNHIFNSRNEVFATDLMRETDGQGVDLVLNSVSGELLHASWNCVAEFGKMVEMGKKDIVEFGKLEMNNFMQSRSYCCVDMTHLAQKRPQRAGAILKKCIELYEAGQIPPLGPISVFDVSSTPEALRQVQDGAHVGKVVVSMPKDTSDLPSMPRPTELLLDSQASYLLTGGLGGLGKVISTWLVERGARSLVFLSRSAAQSPEDRAFFRELETSHCSVCAVPGKAESMEDVRKAISQAPYRIAGVIHLAMVLRDAPVASMAYSDWLAVNSPKVTGAWNLHETLKDQGLDFFVLASSLVTIVEQPGQGNYSASNTFLEAFCQYRHSLSLPASVLNICPIDGVGFVAENAFARKNMKAQGLYFLREPELLDFLELSILTSYPAAQITNSNTDPTKAESWANESQLVMGLRSEGDLNDSNTRTNWRRDRRMGFYHNSNEKASSDKGSSSELMAFLAQVADDPEMLSEARSAEYLSREIGRKVFSFLLKPEEDLDISLTLAQVGLDSLMAIELRRWWKQAFSLEISVLEIMATGTLEALGVVAAQTLKAKLTEKEAST